MPDTKIIADRLIRRLQTFPSLPTVVTRVLEVSSDPRSSIADLKKIIEIDSSLAMEVLKLANSPFFGLRRKVSTLEHGISLLGMAEIKNLVLAKSMFQTFRSIPGADSARLWQHSFYAALAAKIIAPHLSLDCNQCFVAGLIHDVGKLIIYSEIEDEQILWLEQQAPYASVLKEEIKTIGISHDQLGQLLLTKWMFPVCLINAVGFHHKPTVALNHKMVALVVYIANILSHMVSFSESDTQTGHDNKNRERSNGLKQMLFNKNIIKLAREFDFILNSKIVDIFITELEMEIQKEGEIILLLEDDSVNKKK